MISHTFIIFVIFLWHFFGLPNAHITFGELIPWPLFDPAFVCLTKLLPLAHNRTKLAFLMRQENREQ